MLHYIDGMSVVTVTEAKCPMLGIKIYSGSIAAPNGLLAVVDAGGFQ